MSKNAVVVEDPVRVLATHPEHVASEQAQLKLMVRKACLRGEIPICSITPLTRRYMFQTRKGC
jgi:hypothetical protein